VGQLGRPVMQTRFCTANRIPSDFSPLTVNLEEFYMEEGPPTQ